MVDLLSAIVVVPAAYIGMGGRPRLFRVFKEERLSIEAVFQDGFHTLI
jgi:hypothetical protein